MKQGEVQLNGSRYEAQLAFFYVNYDDTQEHSEMQRELNEAWLLWRSLERMGLLRIIERKMVHPHEKGKKITQKEISVLGLKLIPPTEEELERRRIEDEANLEIIRKEMKDRQEKADAEDPLWRYRV